MPWRPNSLAFSNVRLCSESKAGGGEPARDRGWFAMAPHLGEPLSVGEPWRISSSESGMLKPSSLVKFTFSSSSVGVVGGVMSGIGLKRLGFSIAGVPMSVLTSAADTIRFGLGRWAPLGEVPGRLKWTVLGRNLEKERAQGVSTKSDELSRSAGRPQELVGGETRCRQILDSQCSNEDGHCVHIDLWYRLGVMDMKLEEWTRANGVRRRGKQDRECAANRGMMEELDALNQPDNQLGPFVTLHMKVFTFAERTRFEEAKKCAESGAIKRRRPLCKTSCGDYEVMGNVRRSG